MKNSVTYAYKTIVAISEKTAVKRGLRKKTLNAILLFINTEHPELLSEECHQLVLGYLNKNGLGYKIDEISDCDKATRHKALITIIEEDLKKYLFRSVENNQEFIEVESKSPKKKNKGGKFGFPIEKRKPRGKKVKKYGVTYLEVDGQLFRMNDGIKDTTSSSDAIYRRLPGSYESGKRR